MSKLTDDEIRDIVKKASLLQKFGEHVSDKSSAEPDKEVKQLFEITDELGLPRKYAYEAYLEYSGVPVHEPFLADTLDFNSAKAIGFAHGTVDKELLNELKNHAEYHFNTMGDISHRRNKIMWKAKPSGVSRMIASASSPKIEFEQVDGSTKITVSQSLKTHNKLYLPSILAGFGGFLLLAAVIFGLPGNNEIAPMLLISALIILTSLFFARFVNSKAKNKKKNLLELTETLQGKIERHFKASTTAKEEVKREINLPKTEDDMEELDITASTKSRSREQS
jgi:hypothetical protein